MKKRINIWHKLNGGMNANVEKTGIRQKLWYEIVPGVCALEAITLGMIRKRFWNWQSDLYLVLYRDIDKKCIIEWMPESHLCNRI